MAAPVVFVDTAALMALANKDDELHEKAKAINRELSSRRCELITSDWVWTEFLGGASRGRLREAACRNVARLQKSQRTTIIPASRTDWTRGFELYSNRMDKEWSLVDCTSMLICEAREIEDVFTYDHHFVQAGFTALMRA